MGPLWFREEKIFPQISKSGFLSFRIVGHLTRSDPNVVIFATFSSYKVAKWPSGKVTGYNASDMGPNPFLNAWRDSTWQSPPAPNRNVPPITFWWCVK